MARIICNSKKQLMRNAAVGALVIAIVLTSLTGCGSGPSEDVGTLAEGEAIAMVQSQLAIRTTLSLDSGESLNCLVHYDLFNPQWTEEYVGDGVWVVSGGLLNGRWEVFEGSSSVSSEMGSGGTPGC